MRDVQTVHEGLISMNNLASFCLDFDYEINWPYILQLCCYNHRLVSTSLGLPPR